MEVTKTRTYLLTEHERDILKKYVRTGIRTAQVSLLKSRARTALPQVLDDIEQLRESLNI